MGGSPLEAIEEEARAGVVEFADDAAHLMQKGPPCHEE
jgi:hypothetical protein